MTSVSRAAQFAKVHKVLKKHYRPVAPDPNRPVLEHLLFACCLENAHYELAEEAFAALVHTFFDWNEVRVTSLGELSEVLANLPDPRAAANRLKRVLHGIFEATYSFDLEDRRKKNLGPTEKWLGKLDGTTKFSVAYVVQSALGGHAIPIDSGTLATLGVIGLVSEKDAAEGVVPGLERAISKSKGVEFGSLLHQLGADFTANPYSPALRKILLEIEPEAKDRLPQRRAVKPAEKTDAAPPVPQPEAPAAGAAQPPTDHKTEKERASGVKTPAAEERAADVAKKKPAPAKKKPAAAEKEPAPETPAADGPAGKRSSWEGIAKRKPR